MLLGAGAVIAAAVTDPSFLDVMGRVLVAMDKNWRKYPQYRGCEQE